MILKRPFLCDIGEDSALYVHCSGVPGDSIFIVTPYDSVTQRIVLKRPFIDDTGKDSFLHVHCSVLQGNSSCS